MSGGLVMDWNGLKSVCNAAEVGEHARKAIWPVCRKLQCPKRMLRFFLREVGRYASQTKPCGIKRVWSLPSLPKDFHPTVVSESPQVIFTIVSSFSKHVVVVLSVPFDQITNS